MSGNKKLSKAFKKANGSSIIQGEVSSEEKVKLSFSRLELEVMPETSKAMHELKGLTGFETSRIVSFLLDAGTMIFRTMKEQMLKKLQEMTKED